METKNDANRQNPQARCAVVSCTAGTVTVPVDGNSEEEIWKPVGEAIGKMDLTAPDTVYVTVGTESAKLLFREDENGHAKLTPAFSGIRCEPSEYQRRYYIMADLETNVHQMYQLVPYTMGHNTRGVGARWGQTGGGNIGAMGTENLYVLDHAWPSFFYWPQHYQLLKRGYEDWTEEMSDGSELTRELDRLFGNPDVPEEEQKEDAGVELYNKLTDGAKEYLKGAMGLALDEYSPVPQFTKRQITSAEKDLDKMLKILTDIGKDPDRYAETEWLLLIYQFNELVKHQIVLTNTSFRKEHGKPVKQMADFMVKTEGSRKEQMKAMEQAVTTWDSAIQAMSGMLSQVSKTEAQVQSPFGNIGVRYATDKELKSILDLFMADRRYAYRLYMIDAPEFKERQRQYDEENGITEHQTLIHGSPTENIASLIMTHPKTHPGFTTAGKAYGWGVYTARNLAKSIHYTSFSDGFYAGGSACRGYICVFNTSYGKPFFPKGVYNAEEDMRKNGCNCVDAKASASGFMMDEIIFYDEPSLCMTGVLEVADSEEDL